MGSGKIQIFYGDGLGKTTAAIGTGIRAVDEHKTVIIIQFLKGRHQKEESVLKRLEPEMKIFRFEKSTSRFEDLSDQEKQDELLNIRNGLNFGKKVLLTRECDMLILDEVLGLLDQGIISEEDILKLIESRDEGVDLILTGKSCSQGILSSADLISEMKAVKVDN